MGRGIGEDKEGDRSKMKHIIQFSGGLASAYVAFLVSQEFGKENCILMFHDTKTEHPDNLKFKNDVCNFLGMDYIEISSGIDLWDVIIKKRRLPSYFYSDCTRTLKQSQGKKLLRKFKQNKEKFVLYNGFGVHEGNRSSGSIKACEKSGIIVKSPLQDLNIPDSKVMRIITEEWNIKIPVTYYQGFEHANCLPCFKGGREHFKRVWQFYPEAFEKAKWAEKEVSRLRQEQFTVFKLKRRTGRFIYEIKNNKRVKVYETYTIKQPLSELEKRWAEEPVIKQVTTFNHADVWQLDMFEEVAA